MGRSVGIPARRKTYDLAESVQSLDRAARICWSAAASKQFTSDSKSSSLNNPSSQRYTDLEAIRSSSPKSPATVTQSSRRHESRGKVFQRDEPSRDDAAAAAVGGRGSILSEDRSNRCLTKGLGSSD
ncbi:hypothetical protein K0M31_007375 [Melipona bicolor]|uniref:Uncharacterized protein n=1 Tax=Melipona bicolor TaxID=60889 RepID=A0AA40KVX4_9HYME|nr:hypothetical protein K0M31_007375 [Melipona bicolor]